MSDKWFHHGPRLREQCGNFVQTDIAEALSRKALT
jgi:hypothetical protein